MNPALRIVVAGGIGSGKSTVGRLLSERGVYVIDADAVGHGVLNDPAVVEEVMRWWPGAVSGGVVDRARLGAKVFADPDDLRRLEAITHPAIKSRIRELAAAHGSAPVAVELPLMPEWLGPGWMVWVVDAAEDTRVARIVGRGGTPTDAAARMAAQPTRD
ncbi:MAG: dephospho-CoA kinase, partial [Acidimicrobiia bacterium]|nr:dephospho-CoA kinase [Acidimicrobiia bacterium]